MDKKFDNENFKSPEIFAIQLLSNMLLLSIPDCNRVLTLRVIKNIFCWKIKMKKISAISVLRKFNNIFVKTVLKKFNLDLTLSLFLLWSFGQYQPAFKQQYRENGYLKRFTNVT